MKKLLTKEDYFDKYKERHIKISHFYGDLTVEQYNNNIQKMKSLIDKEAQTKELKSSNPNKVLSGFLTFDLNKDLELLDKLTFRVGFSNLIIKISYSINIQIF